LTIHPTYVYWGYYICCMEVTLIFFFISFGFALDLEVSTGKKRLLSSRLMLGSAPSITRVSSENNRTPTSMYENDSRLIQ
jgi:hypothetical protein